MEPGISGRRQGNDLSECNGAGTARPLEGQRVLVAEDNVILSMHVADVLERAGAVVMGPYPFAGQAMTAMETETPDIAVLDHELGDQTSAVVANRLDELGVPFAFFTSHQASDVEANDGVPVLAKPNDAATLLTIVSGLIA